jgi:hypothetical protein
MIHPSHNIRILDFGLTFRLELELKILAYMKNDQNNLRMRALLCKRRIILVGLSVRLYFVGFRC